MYWSEAIGPLPSIGLPMASTTRPIIASPTGTETMRPDPYPGFLHSIGQCRPLSRGQLQIVSPDPLQPVSYNFV